jgi:hypothetical protein
MKEAADKPAKPLPIMITFFDTLGGIKLTNGFSHRKVTKQVMIKTY